MVATGGLALETPGCCRTALANHPESRALQVLSEVPQYTSVYQEKAGVERAEIPALIRMEDRVLEMEVACCYCLEAAHLWAHY